MEPFSKKWSPPVTGMTVCRRGDRTVAVRGMARLGPCRLRSPQCTPKGNRVNEGSASRSRRWDVSGEQLRVRQDVGHMAR